MLELCQSSVSIASHLLSAHVCLDMSPAANSWNIRSSIRNINYNRLGTINLNLKHTF